VVIGGMLASTFVTLMLIPVAYSTATGLVARARAKKWASRWLSKSKGDRKSEEEQAATA
jgi:hypothetical protein